MSAKKQRQAERSRSWYLKNRTLALSRSKAWADENRARVREISNQSDTKRRTRIKNAALLRNYGISLTDWEALFVAQGEQCKLCKASKPRGGVWVVDHCHDTSRIRGIICRPCNSGLGLLGDSLAGIVQAARYLAHYE